MNIYSKLCKARNNIILETEFTRLEKMKILNQLMELAFNNRNHLDQLPEVFQIQNMKIMEERVILEIFRKDFKIDVRSVRLVEESYTKGNTFEIKIY